MWCTSRPPSAAAHALRLGALCPADHPSGASGPSGSIVFLSQLLLYWRPPARAYGQHDIGHPVRVPRVHLHFIGLGAGRLKALIDNLQAQINADLTPIHTDQFHGDALGCLPVHEFKCDRQLRSIGIFPQTITIDIIKPESIKQGVGPNWIVLRVCGGKLWLEHKAARVCCDLARLYHDRNR